MGSEYAKLLIKNQNKRPEGFPPGLWYLMKGPMDVTYEEEGKFGKSMFEATVRKNNLETQLLPDGSGYKVIGLKNQYLMNMNKE